MVLLMAAVGKRGAGSICDGKEARSSTSASWHTICRGDTSAQGSRIPKDPNYPTVSPSARATHTSGSTAGAVPGSAPSAGRAWGSEDVPQSQVGSLFSKQHTSSHAE